MSGSPRPDRHYLLGHSEHELARLDLQDELYRDVTVRALKEGGIAEGMRVLDLGCGTGGVSLAAGELVGPTGAVTGIDRGAEGVSVARGHAAARGMDHVTFVTGEIGELDDSRGFDGLVGRFVLMHQPDPAATLSVTLRNVRPGGSVVMIESHIDILARGAHSVPHSELYDEIVAWKASVVRGAGADIAAGPRLRRTFLDAGLPDPVVRLEARLEGGADSPYYQYLEESARSMLPEAGRLGLDAFTADDVEGLADRIRDEVVALGGVLVAWPVVTAWARKPSSSRTDELVGPVRRG